MLKSGGQGGESTMAPADIGNAPPAYATSANPDPLRGKRIRLDGPTDRGQTAADGGNAAHLTPDPNSPAVQLLRRVSARHAHRMPNRLK